MSNNLPVIWVPPVEPPDPNERPLRRRGNFGVILAAAAIVAVPLVAVALVRETTPRTAEIPTSAAMEATTSAAVPTAPVADVPLPTAKPATARVAVGPAPETSGGNQPYIAGASSAVAHGTPAAPEASVAPRAAVGPDGKPIRVIGIDRPSADMAPSVAPGEAAPERAVEEPPVEPAAASPKPVVAAEPRGAIAEPVTKAAPPIEAAKPAAVETRPDPIVEAKPASPSAPPIGLRTEPSAPAVAATPAPDTAAAKPEKTPLPPKKEVAKTPRVETTEAARSNEADAFADRLAAIRRSEVARAPAQPSSASPQPRTSTQPRTPTRATSRAEVDEPVYEDDDEVIVVAPRRRWGFAPPVFGGPAGPVLRPYEAPSRASMERAAQGENCHYHAWPTEDMAFHRDVRCHWHRDPDDPSIRYVR